MQRSLSVLSLAALAGSVMTCSESAGPPPQPAQIVKAAGDLQTGTVGRSLDSLLVVQVNDERGAPFRGAVVTFAVTQGGGSVDTILPPTGDDGRVSTQWTLGTTAGLGHQVRATVTGVGAVTFSATAAAGPGVALVGVTGNNQAGPVNAPLAEPLVVRIEDQYGNLVAGRRVDFSVTGGGGSVNPTADTTGADGRAQTSWTLGAALGGQTAQAVAAGLTAVPFTATAVSLLKCPVPDARC